LLRKFCEASEVVLLMMMIMTMMMMMTIVMMWGWEPNKSWQTAQVLPTTLR
jgi:hypothetical protein